jgi:hypothetical protein
MAGPKTIAKALGVESLLWVSGIDGGSKLQPGNYPKFFLQLMAKANDQILSGKAPAPSASVCA